MKTVTLEDDGKPLVWKRHFTLQVAGVIACVACVVVAGILAATSDPSGWWLSVLYAGIGVVVGCSLVRPSVHLNHETLTVVSSFRPYVDSTFLIWSKPSRTTTVCALPSPMGLRYQ